MISFWVAGIFSTSPAFSFIPWYFKRNGRRKRERERTTTQYWWNMILGRHCTTSVLRDKKSIEIFPVPSIYSSSCCPYGFSSGSLSLKDRQLKEKIIWQLLLHFCNSWQSRWLTSLFRDKNLSFPREYTFDSLNSNTLNTMTRLTSKTWRGNGFTIYLWENMFALYAFFIFSSHRRKQCLCHANNKEHSEMM